LAFVRINSLLSIGVFMPDNSLIASVVVAVHGNAGDLPGLIRSLRQQTIRAGLFELVVVDNHAEPTIDPAWFGETAFRCRLIHEPVLGLSRARNAGIRAAAGKFILVTDPDSVPDRSWVQSLVGALTDEGALIAGGRAIPLLPADRVLDLRLRQWFVPPMWPARTQELVSPYWIVGCNMGLRRTDPLLLFDENLGAVGSRHRSCEDLELVIRAQRAGRRVIVVPGAIVHRTVTYADLRLAALLSRAFWHGVSVAQLRRTIAAQYLLDSYRLRDVLRERGHLARFTHLARLAGFQGSRLAALAHRPAARVYSTTPSSQARKEAEQNA
jgi:GT2 family glycosyltransferase